MEGRLGRTELLVALDLVRRGDFRSLLLSLRRRRWWFARYFSRPVTLAAYRASIDAFNASQPNRALLDGIRAYNHTTLDHLHGLRALDGRVVLDVGASPHGYALERALELGARHYVGVGLDIQRPTYVKTDRGQTGMLLRDDATALRFPSAMFDLAVSISALEHVADVDAVLAELSRVLKPQALALLTFEPVWSCSYGHHLHHFGDCASLLPPWAHLLWTPAEMRRTLAGRWPADAPLTLEAAIHWVYSGDTINRLTVRDFVQIFQKSPLTVEWMVELKEEHEDLSAAERVSAATGLSVDELVTKGLSVLLSRPA